LLKSAKVFTQTLHAVRRPNQAKGSKAFKQATQAPSISPLNQRLNEYIDQRREEGPVSISDTGSG
jgi:hypothetical protein